MAVDSTVNRNGANIMPQAASAFHRAKVTALGSVLVTIPYSAKAGTVGALFDMIICAENTEQLRGWKGSIRNSEGLSFR